MCSVAAQCGRAVWVFSTSGFHRFLATKPVSSETSKAERRSSGVHSSIWDSWPIAFSGYPRGPRVGCETGCPRHHASNFAVETRSRTRVSQVPGKPPLGLDPLDGTELWEHSSCLWVQISGVEAYSFLPDDQDDRCDFACQGQPRHLGLYSFADLSIVKFLERPCLGGNCRG